MERECDFSGKREEELRGKEWYFSEVKRKPRGKGRGNREEKERKTRGKGKRN